MGLIVKDAGLWKDSEPHVRDSGVWKPVDTGFVKDAGVWKEIYASGVNASTPIGAFIDGGYYLGIITDGGQDWALIVAPKIGGQSPSRLKYSTTYNNSVDAVSFTDGPGNTASISGSNFPAGRFCYLLSLNGFTDWYLPARSELISIYSSRLHLPPHERFDTDFHYWTSTRNATSSGGAYRIDFNSGSSNGDDQGYSGHVRAVRRVAI